jgi:hypothetical protein
MSDTSGGWCGARGAESFIKFVSRTFPDRSPLPPLSAEDGDDPALVHRHELRHEGLEVEDLFGAHLHAVLVIGCPVDELMLQLIIESLHELTGEGLEDDVWGYAVGEELVEHVTSLDKFGGRLFLKNFTSETTDEELPVREEDRLVRGEWDLLNLCRLQHEDGTTDIPLRAETD